MSRRRNRHVNTSNTNPRYWNTVLKGMGLGIDAGKLPRGGRGRRSTAGEWSKAKARA